MPRIQELRDREQVRFEFRAEASTSSTIRSSVYRIRISQRTSRIHHQHRRKSEAVADGPRFQF